MHKFRFSYHQNVIKVGNKCCRCIPRTHITHNDQTIFIVLLNWQLIGWDWDRVLCLRMYNNIQ